MDAELVFVAGFHPGHEQFPNAVVLHHPGDVGATVPGIEVADDLDAPRVGGPNREVHAVDAVDGRRVGPEQVVQLVMVALSEQEAIGFAESGRDGVGVDRLADVAGGVSGFQAVTRRGGGVGRTDVGPVIMPVVATDVVPGCRRRPIANRLEHPARVDLPHRSSDTTLPVDDRDRRRPGLIASHRGGRSTAVVDRVGAQQGGGIRMVAVDQTADILQGDGRMHRQRWFGRGVD